MSARTVSDGVAAMLYAEGVRVAYGMPGGDTLHLIRAFARVGIRFVLVRDEASAAFAADATAQLTQTPGVCVATLGPGMTNLASGVAGCTLDRAPVLAFTSRYRSDRHGIYTHMILDQGGIMAATGKAVVRLGATHAAGELRRALVTATLPRPGAVWVEVPTEVAGAPWVGPDGLRPLPAAAGLPASEAFVRRVAAWRRPVVLVGTAHAGADVSSLAERLRAPVFTTYKAKGVLPEGVGWSAGAVGLSPPVDALHQSFLAEADGLLLVGWDPVELRDHWLPGWPAATEVAVIDASAPPDLPSRVDALHVGAPAAAVASVQPGASEWRPAEVAAHRARWEALHEEAVFGPATALRAVQAAVDADGRDVVVTLDVGAHRICASNVWRCRRPDRLLQSNGWSSMGYGVPAALAAAWVGHPAVAVVGDMGLQLMLGELGAIRESGVDVVVVVLLDDSLSLIELKQERMGHPIDGVRFGSPDLPTLAAAFGGTGREVGDVLGVQREVARALEEGGLQLVGVRIDPAPYRVQM